MKVQILILLQIMSSFCIDDYPDWDGNEEEKTTSTEPPENEPPYSGKWNFIAVIEQYHRGYFKHACDGSLISSDCILTAGHCLINSKDDVYPVENIIARLGVYNVKREKGTQVKISHFVFQQHFNSSSYENDIAIIKLATPVNQTYRIRYARLASLDSMPDSEVCKAAGWRMKRSKLFKQRQIRTDDNLDWEDLFSFESYDTHEQDIDFESDEDYQRRKRSVKNLLGRNLTPNEDIVEVEVPVLTHETCTKHYKDLKYVDSIFCTSSSDGDMSYCMGDPGGPLACDSEYKLFGITSRGTGCINPNWPGVNIIVSKYERWIAENCNIHEKKAKTEVTKRTTENVTKYKLARKIKKAALNQANKAEKRSKLSLILYICVIFVFIINNGQ